MRGPPPPSLPYLSPLPRPPVGLLSLVPTLSPPEEALASVVLLTLRCASNLNAEAGTSLGLPNAPPLFGGKGWARP